MDRLFCFCDVYDTEWVIRVSHIAGLKQCEAAGRCQQFLVLSSGEKVQLNYNTYRGINECLTDLYKCEFF